ncbi:MAG: ureidoglycolate lyase [Kaiparowitsia implicata GSE-PSE-MK54-09C]|nr:ureidoglycolate lyase [Kaiparowitsia implicata GSE-PSE-MK54-09C]
MLPSPTLKHLTAEWVTSERFQAFGQVITASPDGKAFDHSDAQLILDQGIPRFYIMRLHRRGRQFHTITRHQRCTQCLGSLEGQDWLIAVAPSQPAAQPALDEIRAFRIPGNCFIKLNLGTWHAGPYFDQEVIDFYNLELNDTNSIDHETCNLQQAYGVTVELM